MIRFAAVALFAVLLSAPTARATLGGSCCACVSSDQLGGAQTSGTNRTAETLVLFCAESADTAPLVERCDAASPPASLICALNVPGPSCRQQLADSGIACPVAGAPAAAPLNLATLAIVLSALGTMVLRRRLGGHVSRKDRP